MVDILKNRGWNLMGIAHYAIRLVCCRVVVCCIVEVFASVKSVGTAKMFCKVVFHSAFFSIFSFLLRPRSLN